MKLVMLNECGFSEGQKAIINAINNSVRWFVDTFSEDQAISRIGDADTIIMDQFMFTFGEKLLKACPNLKKVIVNTTAFDKIPVNLLKKYDVELKNLPAYATEDVVETALSMIFQLNQRTSHAQYFVTTGERDIVPNSYQAELVMRRRLTSQEVTILGMGSIGSGIFRDLNKLGVNTYPFSRKSPLSLKDAVVKADIVVMAMSYQPGVNDKILSGEILSAMKDDAIIVSIAPSELIDIDWLIAHPEKFSGIGFDYLVTDKVRDYLSVRKGGIIITPHLGSQSREALYNMTEGLISLIF